MNKVYILGGLRTPIGITNGRLKNVPPEDLAGKLIKEALNRYDLKKVDEVILGNAVGAGGNISRLSTLKAGLNVPAFTIDMQCTSSLMAISVAYSKICCGLCDVIIVGGVESTSMEPIRGYSKNHPRYIDENSTYKVAQFSPGDYDESAMIKGAERVASKYNISMEELNFWSIESHKRAIEAREKGVLKDIIVPIENISKDEGIRENMNDRLLKRLKPILNSTGKITSGNACLTHDGAGILVLCSEKYLKENNIKETFKIVSFASTSGNSDFSPEQANKVVDKLLINNNLEAESIDVFEINEAFGVIDVLYERRFKEKDKLNILGGALAYGHPYGASGAIISIHLLKALEVLKGKYGVVAIPAAGGLGMAMLIERLDNNEIL